MQIQDQQISETFQYTFANTLKSSPSIEKQLTISENEKYNKHYRSFIMPNSELKVNFPIHDTIKHQLVSKGLIISDFEREMVDGFNLLTFEIKNYDLLNLADLEYELVKEFSLNKNNIVLTLV